MRIKTLVNCWLCTLYYRTGTPNDDRRSKNDW